MLKAATSLLRLLPEETAHRLTVRLVRAVAPLLPKSGDDDPRLSVTAFGLDFPNPIGLAAGFDKDAEIPDGMLRFGFGFVECGTITPLPQKGNPKPRLFRLTEDRAVINRMGFNGRGMAHAAGLLAKRTAAGIVGVNIGANKDTPDRMGDYQAAFRCLAPHASYVTVNVSSPNTPGLRGLQNRDELKRLLALLVVERARVSGSRPILLKIAPDLEDAALDDIADVSLGAGIDGIVVSNTTLSRPTVLRGRHAAEAGGLSGKPLFSLSTDILRHVRRRVGTKLVLVGVGGVGSGADAYRKIRAGASLVHLYTALAFEGPGLVRRIKRELLACLARDGLARSSDAVGSDLR